MPEQWTYEAVLSPAELALLRQLVGKSLDSVWTNSWSALVCASGTNFLFCPEEVATPSPSHRYADVDRPRVESDAPAPSKWDALVCRDLGKITQINLLRGRVSFSPVVDGPPIDIRGVEIPAGPEFGLLFLEPGGTAIAAPADDAPIVTVDLGIELSTDRGHVVTLFTQGLGHFVHVVADGALPPELSAHVQRRRIEADN